MRIPLQDFDKRTIAAVLRFANLPSIESDASERRAAAIFQPFVRDWMPMLVKFDPVTGRQEEAPMMQFTEMYKELHAIARGWLGRIVDARSSPRATAARVTEALAKEVEAAFSEEVSASLTLFPRVRLRYVCEINGAPAAVAFAVALILDEGRGLRDRLARCGYSKCGKFNLDSSPTGRPRRFCDADHARRYDAEDSKYRQKRYRNKLESASKRAEREKETS
jgi:hypothetical protein